MTNSIHPRGVAEETSKPVHTILLDASPILLNAPSISTLLATCETIITTQSVIEEIRGEEARHRFETLYKPFLTIRSPKPQSIRHVREFARRTGDLPVLSATDFEVLALAYDLECERNGGDWRLRNTPGQKKVNGSPPQKDGSIPQTEEEVQQSGQKPQDISPVIDQLQGTSLDEKLPTTVSTVDQASEPDPTTSQLSIVENRNPEQDFTEVNSSAEAQNTIEVDERESDSGSDEGWITPSNIKRRQKIDDSITDSTSSKGQRLQVATMTGDFAMQNVLLQMNLNLLSTKTCKRVTNIKQMILRCHACFATTKDMSKQFCSRCGKPTLTRVNCTTNDKGEVKLHLNTNFQWNNRGNVYSVPKPVSSSSNQKWKGSKQGGGKGGWGSDLVLAEDQKEYVRAMSRSKRTKNKDLMGEDTLPSILSGVRDGREGTVKVGAGRTVNSKKR